jgi:choline dehydrogenase-like flavoprotein
MRTPSDPADVCIVGSGPAGAILAASLAENGHEVVILEAGRRFDRAERVQQMERALRPGHTDNIWEMGGQRDRYTSSGSRYYGLNGSRVKGIGGTTLHWGGMTPRLHPEDFEMQTRYGVGEDWPISYADIEPYYLRAEQVMGVSGAPNQFTGPRSGEFPMPPVPASYSDQLIGAACASLGINLHPVPRAINTQSYDGRSECVGYGTCDPVCPSGAKYDASVHVRKAEEHGARVIDRAPVQRLEHDESGDRVVEAVYATPDGTEHSQHARYFVVACGAVESVRLLLLSESAQYPDGLANSSGVLGRYFMEHPGVRVTGRVDEPTRQHLIGYSTRMSKQYYSHDRGPEGTMIIELSNNAGVMPVKSALREKSLSGEVIRGNLAAPFEGDEWGDDHLDRVAEQSTQHLSLNGIIEQLPDPENTISVDRTKVDNHGNAVPEIDYSVGDRTQKKLKRAEGILVDILEELGATEIESEFPPENPFTAYHHMGVTRMGTDPAESVVTPQLQTHDLSNLYISSSGVFVTGGASNPTLTIAALTLRLADHLNDRLQGGAG